MKFYISCFAILLFATTCNFSKNNSKTINQSWIDSIIAKSDSSYTKPYDRTDFVTAEYFINKADSSVLQLMKDSAGKIRQVILAKNDSRIYFGQYYANGNVQSDLPLDEFGQFHGTGVFYYEDGSIQSSGTFNHGLRAREWKIFDKDGKLMSTDKYDQNGQMLPPH